MRFRGEQILKRALCTLDLTREHSFLAHVHEHEQIRVRKRKHRTIEAAKCAIRIRQDLLEVVADADRWVGRKRRRNERPNAGRLKLIMSSSPRIVLRGNHTSGCLYHGDDSRSY